MEKQNSFEVKSKKKGGEKMKKVLLMVAAIALFAAVPAMAAILDSKHDLSSGGAARVQGTQTQICIYCHTPHNSSATMPLWNRTASTPTVDYTSPSLNSTRVAYENAQLCLSCHDGADLGTVMEDFGVSLATTPANLVGRSSEIGTDLSNDHPVGIQITGNDAGIETLVLMKGKGIAGSTYKFFGAGSDVMDCATCHDVHNGPAGTVKFLRNVLTDSTLCLDCHINK